MVKDELLPKMSSNKTIQLICSIYNKQRAIKIKSVIFSVKLILFITSLDLMTGSFFMHVLVFSVFTYNIHCRSDFNHITNHTITVKKKTVLVTR